MASSIPHRPRTRWFDSAGVSVYGLFAAPFAIIKKMEGYDKQEGVDLQTVPVKSGGDCVTFVATGQIEPRSHRSGDRRHDRTRCQARGVLQPVPGAAPRSWCPKIPIKTSQNSRARRSAFASTAPGTVVAKGLIKAEGMDPEKDVKFVSVGSANAAALFLKDGTLDAISINTSDHATISLFIGPKRHLEFEGDGHGARLRSRHDAR